MEQVNLTLKSGETDSLGNVVSRILARDVDKKYVIWETTDGEVVCDGDEDVIDSAVSTWTLKVRGLIRTRKQFAGKYNGHIGHAYKHCFEKNASAGIETLKETYEEIRRRLLEESRILYLVGSLIATVICESVLGFEYFHQTQPEIIRRTIAGLALAVLGGFMSVATNLQKQRFELVEKRVLTVAYGALRLTVALIAGIVAALMISTGVALSFLQQQDAFGGFLLACFLAGFSERLILSRLRQIEDDVVKT